jgi:hypothetical protein
VNEILRLIRKTPFHPGPHGKNLLIPLLLHHLLLIRKPLRKFILSRPWYILCPRYLNMEINGVKIDNTFAEAFPAWVSSVIVTAATKELA